MAKKKAKDRKKKKPSIWVQLGRKGGKARAARLTAAQRHHIAMMGVEARREKRLGKKPGPDEPGATG